MRMLVLALILGSAGASAQSVTTYGYDAHGRLATVRDGMGSRSDYALDATDNRSAFHGAQQFATAWQATSLPHIVGYADCNGWALGAGQSGFMTYGPYTTGIPAGNHVATWRILIDNNDAANDTLVGLDVFDATSGQILASAQVTRRQWAASWAYQVFELPFTISTAGHQLEIRTQSFGGSYIRVEKVGYY